MYEVTADPQVKDLKYGFIGPKHQPGAKAAHNLDTKSLYHERCGKGSFPIPILLIFFEDELWGHSVVSLSIECGEIVIQGEHGLGYENLLRREKWS